jgi:hypothetical protein
MVSRILQSDEPSSYWSWRHERNVPSNRTDEIEVDNEAPCYSFGLKRSWRVEELELYDMSEREKKGKNICLFEGCEWIHAEIKQICVARDRIGG